MEAALHIICEIVDVVLRQIDDETQFDDVRYDMDRLEQMIKCDEDGGSVPETVKQAYIALFRELYAAKGCMCEVILELKAVKLAAEQELRWV
jgi:hypothetical protein